MRKIHKISTHIKIVCVFQHNFPGMQHTFSISVPMLSCLQGKKLILLFNLFIDSHTNRLQKPVHKVISLNVWTDGNLTEPDLANKVDARGVRSHSHVQWPWQNERCELVRCHGEEAFPVSTFPGACSWLLYAVYGLAQRNTCLWQSRLSLSIVSQQNTFTVLKYGHHSLAGQDDPAKLDHWRWCGMPPLHALIFRFRVEVVSPGLIPGHISTQKLVRICRIQFKITVERLHPGPHDFNSQCAHTLL